jgi:hypothetical protein
MKTAPPECFSRSLPLRQIHCAKAETSVRLRQQPPNRKFRLNRHQWDAFMPITLHIDHGHNEVHAVATGPIRYADIEKHLLTERNFQGLAYKELVDARDATLLFSLSPAEIRSIVILVRTLSKQSKLGPTAVLVSDDYAYGAMRVLEMLLEDVAEIKPFRDEQKARAWLATKSAAS